LGFPRFLGTWQKVSVSGGSMSAYGAIAEGEHPRSMHDAGLVPSLIAWCLPRSLSLCIAISIQKTSKGAALVLAQALFRALVYLRNVPSEAGSFNKAIVSARNLLQDPSCPIAPCIICSHIHHIVTFDIVINASLELKIAVLYTFPEPLIPSAPLSRRTRTSYPLTYQVHILNLIVPECVLSALSPTSWRNLSSCSWLLH